MISENGNKPVTWVLNGDIDKDTLEYLLLNYPQSVYKDADGEHIAIEMTARSYNYFNRRLQKINNNVRNAAVNKLSGGDNLVIFLLELFCSPQNRQASIGCLLEARDEVRVRHGERRARFYFWWQVTRTILHFAFSALKRLPWIAASLGFMGWIVRKLSS